MFVSVGLVINLINASHLLLIPVLNSFMHSRDSMTIVKRSKINSTKVCPFWFFISFVGNIFLLISKNSIASFFLNLYQLFKG